MSRQLLQSITAANGHIDIDDKMLLKSKTITKEEIKKLQDKYSAGISD
jgi:hypothetical protein